MTERKKSRGSRKKPTGALGRVVTSVEGDVVTITPTNVGDIREVAAALLKAASSPDDVRTMTAPRGWMTSKRVAKAAGLL